MSSPAPPAAAAVLRAEGCYAEVTPVPLDHQSLVKEVEDAGAGAIATFIGVTRDNFQGKRTERLEYEAYVPMATRKLLVGVGLVRGSSAPLAPRSLARTCDGRLT